MKRILTALALLIIVLSANFGQYDESIIVISGGTYIPMYLGKGEGDNLFSPRLPGFQFEFTFNNYENFEWVIWGIAHSNAINKVGESEVDVSFWMPYYTEFLFYQREKKNPLFMSFGYDYVRMRFPEFEKPDSHHNLTISGGWNLHVFNKAYLQFKVKPYIILGNSIGQWFGTNFIMNVHLGVSN